MTTVGTFSSVARARSRSDGDCDRPTEECWNLTASPGFNIILRRTFLEVRADNDIRHSLPQWPLCSPLSPAKVSHGKASTAAVRWSDVCSEDELSTTDGETDGSSDSDSALHRQTQSRQIKYPIRNCACVPTISNPSIPTTATARGLPQQGDMCTTLLFKHLPAHCTSDLLASKLNEHGLMDVYNFIYVPWNLQKQIAVGFAFVNMTSHEGATSAIARLQGCMLFSQRKDLALEICWAEQHQGLAAQIARYRDSAIMHPSVPDSFKPKVFSEGVCQPFPEPTTTLNTPPTAAKRRRRTHHKY